MHISGEGLIGAKNWLQNTLMTKAKFCATSDHHVILF